MIAVGALAIGSTLAGCGGSDDASADEHADDGLAPLVATTTVWADVTSNVACGEEVTAVIPAGADPHAFEPSLRDRERLGDAAVVIANGLELEESLADVLQTLAADGVTVVEVADAVDDLDGDPHIWQDPQRVAAAVDAIETAVIASGRPAAEIEQCATRYRAELEQLDTEVTELLAPIQPERRLLVTNHDAFSYFADRYGFEIVGSVIPSSSTLAESSAGELAELANAIEQQAVPAIFTERLGSSHDAEALADRLGVAVVELDSDALAGEGPTATYVGMIRANAEAIAAALA
jgi:zinc/manganese transport system substrate-binding protein